MICTISWSLSILAPITSERVLTTSSRALVSGFGRFLSSLLRRPVCARELCDRMPRYEESIEPRFEDYADDDPFGLVRSLNLSRRHLTLAQKKEVAKHIFEREPGRTANSVAQEVGLAPQTAQKVQDEVDSSYLKNSNKDSTPAAADDLPTPIVAIGWRSLRRHTCMRDWRPSKSHFCHGANEA